MTGSFTTSQTFTVTNARYLASKIATDLKRIQRFYGRPSDAEISDYQREAIELLKAGYFGTVTYGFKRNGAWVEPTLRYTARDLAGMTSDDDDPGRVRPRAVTTGAHFSSYMTYSSEWDELTSDQQLEFKKNKLPFQRVGADEPGVSGYLSLDRTYSSGGLALERRSVRNY